jgi:hypothetical protein
MSITEWICVLSPLWLGIPLAAVVCVKIICWALVCTNVHDWWSYITAVLAQIFVTLLFVLVGSVVAYLATSILDKGYTKK